MSSSDARETCRPLVKVTWHVEIGPRENAKRLELTTHVPDAPLATDEHLRGRARDKLDGDCPDGRWCYAEVSRHD